MKIAIVGLGNQGIKRLRIAGSDVVCTVDPNNPQASHRTLLQIGNVDIDAAILCLPEEEKIKAVAYFLERNCHVLVEKPLTSDRDTLNKIRREFLNSRLILQTAYNHRFEPHFRTIKEIVQSGKLGNLYRLQIHYGNGTSKLVKESPWRDHDLGVLPDIGSHVLDLLGFWFGEEFLSSFLEDSQTMLSRNEVTSFDSFSIRGAKGKLQIDLSGSYLNWKNRFFLELIGSDGTVEMDGLCKWGPSELSIHKRKIPSGRPEIKSQILIQDDPTWNLEYEDFKKNCKSIKMETNNMDLILNSYFDSIRMKLLQE